MKHRSKDVSEPTRPRYDRPPSYGQPRGAVVPGTIPPTSQVPRPLPPIEPPTAVSGFAETGVRSIEGSRPSFTLPESVSVQQIRQDSFRYGGARSADRSSTKP